MCESMKKNDFLLWEKKKKRRPIRISPRLFIILPNALASKEAKCSRFFWKVYMLNSHLQNENFCSKFLTNKWEFLLNILEKSNFQN